MKRIFDDPKYLINELTKLLKGLSQLIETESGKAFFETTIIYFLNATKLNPDQLKEKISEISEKAAEMVETGAMYIQRNVEEKVILNMIKNGFDDLTIMKCVKLPLERIEALRELSMSL
jgi:wyosine [tRNA(Phe)-imidazoG37] synthetase (radical SAM superfamily)